MGRTETKKSGKAGRGGDSVRLAHRVRRRRFNQRSWPAEWQAWPRDRSVDVAVGLFRRHCFVAIFDFASSPAVTTTRRAGSIARRKAALTCSVVNAVICASNCLLHA